MNPGRLNPIYIGLTDIVNPLDNIFLLATWIYIC
jgi:hypothetical protein